MITTRNKNEAPMYQLLIGADKINHHVTSQRILAVQSKLVKAGIAVKARQLSTANFIDYSEQVLCFAIDECDFGQIFQVLQEIRKSLDLEKVSIRNKDGVRLTITEDTFYCRGYAALLHIPTLVLKEGVEAFDPASEDMIMHKDFYISSTNSWGYDGMANRFFTWMPMRMNNKFSYYDLFRLSPSGASRISPGGASRKINQTDWIPKNYSIAPNEWLLWHPNETFEAKYKYVYRSTPDPMHL